MLNETIDLKGLSTLVFEDNPIVLKGVEESLKEFGAKVYPAVNFAHLSALLEHQNIHIILVSIHLVDKRCIELIDKYKALRPDTLFYLLADENYTNVEMTDDYVKFLVNDFFLKPLDVRRFAQTIVTTLGLPSSASKSLSLVEPLVTRTKPYFLFRSEPMRRALMNLPKMAASDQTILISGETGTGKELVARAVHELSKRANGPFVAVNCGAVPETLIESELFGHEKGSFTGALRSKKGKFELAHKGTLFLDEIGDMAINLQVRLLRALEEGTIYRVGGEEPVPVNVRVVAATRVGLKKAIADGLFRDDLYYRLNVLNINIPPLRERIDDISLLSFHFMRRAFSEMGRELPYPSISTETIHLLESYPWKGNIRELRNIITRVATLLPNDTQVVFPMHVQPHLEEWDDIYDSTENHHTLSGVFIPTGTKMSDAENMLIHDALNYMGGNKTKAAELLGIGLRTIRRKLNRE